MTVDPDGKPNVTAFGNFQETAKLGEQQMGVTEEREPLTDVIESAGEVRVIIELPCVGKNDIKLSGTDDTLTISVDIPEHKYFKEVALPAKVAIKKAASAYQNGVLEVTIPKKKQQKTESRSIKIE